MRIEPTTAALAWHLQANVYPPVTPRMVPAARKAIRLCQRGTPEDLVSIGGVALFPAESIVADLRLESFVGED